MSVPLTDGVSWGVVLTPWITWISVGVAVANVLLIVMSASLRGKRRSPERNYHASARSLTVTKTERSR